MTPRALLAVPQESALARRRRKRRPSRSSCRLSFSVAGQSLNLTQYLQQAAQQNAAANAVISVRGPQAAQGDDGDYVPTATALPYTVSFSNPSEQPAGQLRIVTELDADPRSSRGQALDIRSLRLGDLKIGDINVHVPVGARQGSCRLGHAANG